MRHGNVMNLIVPDANTVPEIGTGATILMWSDRKAGTVIAADAKTIVVQEDDATRTDNNGMSDSQSYDYTPNPKGRLWTFTKRRNGKFFEAGSASGQGSKLRLGIRDAYYDFGF